MAMTSSGPEHAEGRGIFTDAARDVLCLSASDLTPLADPRRREAALTNAFCPATVGVLGLDDLQDSDVPARDMLLLRFD